MSKIDRELHKQLLLMKGEALRTQLTLEAQRWRQPSHLLREGASLFGFSGASGLLGGAVSLLREGKLRRWLRLLLAAAGLLRLLRRK